MYGSWVRIPAGSLEKRKVLPLFFMLFIVGDPDLYREGGHKINLQGAGNKSLGTSIASRKGAGSP